MMHMLATVLVSAYLFTASPTTAPPKPDSCIIILHTKERVVEQRHCDLTPGKKVRGTLYLVD